MPRIKVGHLMLLQATYSGFNLQTTMRGVANRHTVLAQSL